LAIWATTVGVPRYGGRGGRPRPAPDADDQIPRIVLIQTIVIRALRASGWRKTLTPFEMASVPVSADPPEAKAFMTMNSDAPSSSPLPGCCRCPRPPWCERHGRGATRDRLHDADHDEDDHVAMKK
jgi:hypothetical protein